MRRFSGASGGGGRHLLSRLSRSLLADKLAVINTSSSASAKGTEGRLTYRELLHDSFSLAKALRARNLKEPTVAAFQRPGSNYVSTMLATWMIGKRFLPLCTTHPEAELRYFVQDSRAGCIVYTSEDACSKHSYAALPNLGVSLLDSSTLPASTAARIQQQDADKEIANMASTAPDMSSDALILYTSGTTGRPKGVVHSHHGVTCMMEGLVSSWQYVPEDHILHFLPLHHLHGVLNKLLCVLYAGGSVEFLHSAAPEGLWQRLSADEKAAVTLFMAVPTVYARMIESAHDSAADESVLQKALKNVRANTRIMACGSAALPDTVMETWRTLTGQTLLERYGMTEIGMGLSNDYLPVSNRTPGHVGKPLPFVEVRLVDDHEQEIPGSNSVDAPLSVSGGADKDEDVPGELRVRGPTVFREYLNRPEVYKESFDAQGWFKTGDVAVRRRGSGMYAILGRNSTDIIKARGYKLSALEIERELLACSLVKEVAVIGSPHPIDGEQVVAVTVLQAMAGIQDESNNTSEIRAFLRDRLASYKCPAKYVFTKNIPRNALGKVNKKTLLKDLGIKL